MKLLDATSAEGVAAVHKDPGDAFAHVVLEPAELADVETPRPIVQVHDIHHFIYK